MPEPAKDGGGIPQADVSIPMGELEAAQELREELTGGDGRDG